MREKLNIPTLTDPKYAYLNTVIRESSKLFLAQVNPANILAITKGVYFIQEEVMKMAEDLPISTEGKNAGMLCIARRGYHATSPLLVEVGQVADLDSGVWNEKRNKYAFYALAKAVVLGQHPEFSRSEENTSLRRGKLFIRKDLTDEHDRPLKEQQVVGAGGIALENGFAFFVERLNSIIGSLSKGLRTSSALFPGSASCGRIEERSDNR